MTSPPVMHKGYGTSPTNFYSTSPTILNIPKTNGNISSSNAYSYRTQHNKLAYSLLHNNEYTRDDLLLFILGNTIELLKRQLASGDAQDKNLAKLLVRI